MAQEGFEQVEMVVRTIAQTAVDNETYFCELDAVVGDGDFGYSLARGFEIVLADWDDLDRTDAATFLQKIAVIITSRIGGTSGPIWGTAFLRAGGAVAGADAIGGDEVVAMLRAAIEGIKQRGQSDVGDKTLLDALVPATDALEEGLRAGQGAARARRGGRDGPRGGGGHHEHARQAGARLLHRRAQHREPGRRGHGRRGHVRGARQGLARDLAARRSHQQSTSEERCRREEVRQ